MDTTATATQAILEDAVVAYVSDDGRRHTQACLSYLATRTDAEVAHEILAEGWAGLYDLVQPGGVTASDWTAATASVRARLMDGSLRTSWGELSPR